MKKFLIVLTLLAVVVGTASAGGLTYDKANYKNHLNVARTASTNDPIMNTINEVDGMLDGTGTSTITNLLFDNTVTSDPTSTEGRLYYNTTSNKFKFYNGSTWVTIEAGSTGNSLDEAYDVGNAITVDGNPVTLTTATTSGIIAMSIDHGGASNNSDGLAIAHAGAGDGVQVTCEDTDSVAARLIAAASQTVSLAVLDASTNNWDGADNVGLLHLQTDDPFIHAGASALVITDSSTPITAAEGFLARFIHTGTARTNSSAVEIEVPATQPALALNGILAITGQDSVGASLVQIVGNDGTGNSDTMTVNAEGTGSAMKVTCDDADSVGITAVAAASQTTSLVVVDAATNNFDGADNVGMLHITADDPLIHTGASLFAIVNSGQPIAAAEGFAFRIVDTGTARTDAYAMEIETTNTTPAFKANNQVSISGADQAGVLFDITGIDTTGNTDTATIDHSGTGNALYIDLNEADSQGITIEPFTNATVAALEIDGDAAGWDGADNVGMVHIRNDDPGIHAGATLLLVDDSSQPISAAEGFLARFVATGAARTNAYAVEVEVPATQPAFFSNGIVTVTGQDSVGATLVQITGNNGTGNGDTMSINTEGTGDGLQVTCDDADSVGVNLVAATSQTTSLLKVDGATGSFLGADDVGMIHVTNDGALAHVDSSLLRIANSGVPQDDSRGSCLRIVDTGNAAAGTAGYAAYISATDATVEALYIDDGEVLVDEVVIATKGLQTGVGETLTANSDSGAASTIDEGVSVANVTAANAGVNDWIVLPDSIIGREVWVYANVGANFEIRTPAASNDTINNVDSDGTQEFLATDTSVYYFRCHTATGWIGVAYTNLGAHGAAVVPD
jgi:hypothetical protein